MRAQRRFWRKASLLRKRYVAAGQEHVLAGLKEGEQAQKSALLEQLLRIDLRVVDACLREALSEQGPVGLGAAASSSSSQVAPPPSFPKADWTGLRSWLRSTAARVSVPAGGSILDASPAELDPQELPGETRGSSGVGAPAEGGSGEGDKKSVVQMRRWWKKGLELAAQGKVATLVLAGGQSTRLGSQAPPSKGMLDIGLRSGKSLFQLQAERLRRVEELAQKEVPGVTVQIPWLVMTSDATDDATRSFFEEHNFFDLDASQVWFMKQKSLPCVAAEPAPSGRHQLLLAELHRVAEAPAGNGSVFEALQSSGLLGRLRQQGVELLQIYAVDNALVKVADPVFYGYCHERRADVGIKTVERKDPQEAVGVVIVHTPPFKTAADVLQEPSGLDASPEPANISASKGVDMQETRSREGASVAEADGVKQREGLDTNGERFYSVIEYSEMDDAVKFAAAGSKGRGRLSQSVEKVEGKEASEREGEGNGEGLLLFRAAHIGVNVFSVSFLEKLGSREEWRLPYHAAKKRVPYASHDGTGRWEEVVPAHPNGIKLERFIFDVFRFASKVALLEVERGEEFAPVKDAPREGATDTAESARNLLLALDRHVGDAQDWVNP